MIEKEVYDEPERLMEIHCCAEVHSMRALHHEVHVVQVNDHEDPGCPQIFDHWFKHHGEHHGADDNPKGGSLTQRFKLPIGIAETDDVVGILGSSGKCPSDPDIPANRWV